MPAVDRSSPSSYLRSCRDWLDAMEHWRADMLPGWIEQTRMHLLEQALMNPGQLDVPALRTANRPAERALDTAAEIRLPVID